MKEVTIAGRTVPAIGLGTWHMGDNPASRETEIAAIRAGIDAGARVIDTAEMYGGGRSEKLVGQAIADYDRKKLFIIDKVLPQNAVPGRFARSLDRSLSLVGVDSFDLYLYHWRQTANLAPMVAEMEKARQAGKIKAWGVSNFDLSDMQELLTVPGGNYCAANEDLYNLSSRGIDYDLLPWQRQHNLPMIAYTPVASGGRGRMGIDVAHNSAVKEVAARHQVSPFAVMLAWTIRQPGVLAIPQSSNPDHAKANVAAGELTLTATDLASLEAAFPKPTRHLPLDVL